MIASTALKLLRLKPEYFFLGHPVYLQVSRSGSLGECYTMHILAINLHINININDLNDEPTKKSIRINVSPSALRLPFIFLKFLTKHKQ